MVGDGGGGGGGAADKGYLRVQGERDRQTKTELFG